MWKFILIGLLFARSVTAADEVILADLVAELRSAEPSLSMALILPNARKIGVAEGQDPSRIHLLLHGQTDSDPVQICELVLPVPFEARHMAITNDGRIVIAGLSILSHPRGALIHSQSQIAFAISDPFFDSHFEPKTGWKNLAWKPALVPTLPEMGPFNAEDVRISPHGKQLFFAGFDHSRSTLALFRTNQEGVPDAQRSNPGWKKLELPSNGIKLDDLYVEKGNIYVLIRRNDRSDESASRHFFRPKSESFALAVLGQNALRPHIFAAGLWHPVNLKMFRNRKINEIFGLQIIEGGRYWAAGLRHAPAKGLNPRALDQETYSKNAHRREYPSPLDLSHFPNHPLHGLSKLFWADWFPGATTFYRRAPYQITVRDGRSHFIVENPDEINLSCFEVLKESVKKIRPKRPSRRK